MKPLQRPLRNTVSTLAWPLGTQPTPDGSFSKYTLPGNRFLAIPALDENFRESFYRITATPDKPAITNLLGIYAGLTDKTVPEIEGQYEGKGYGDFKKDLAEVVVEGLSPIRERTLELLDDPKELDDLLEAGAEKARAVARPVLRDAASRMGLD